jgi:hypothetical protein
VFFVGDDSASEGGGGSRPSPDMTLIVLARANCLLVADLRFPEDKRVPGEPARGVGSREPASSLSRAVRFDFETDPEVVVGLVGDI